MRKLVQPPVQGCRTFLPLLEFQILQCQDSIRPCLSDEALGDGLAEGF